MNDANINFSSLHHLEDLGLIKFSSLSGFVKEGFTKHVTIFYYGIPINIEFPNDEKNKIDLGKVMLTKIGKELAPISKSLQKDDFFDYIIEKWYKQGLILSSPIKQVK